MRAAHHHPHHVHHDVGERVEALLARLRADGGRVTTGRRAVVQALMTADDHHVTAEDVAALVQRSHPDVHRSTIYRTLDALERLGAVDRLSLGPGPGVYHLRDHVHHHFVCEGCHTVIELEDDLVRPWIRTLSDAHRIGPASQLTVTGRCGECHPAR